MCYQDSFIYWIVDDPDDLQLLPDRFGLCAGDDRLSQFGIAFVVCIGCRDVGIVHQIYNLHQAVFSQNKIKNQSNKDGSLRIGFILLFSSIGMAFERSVLGKKTVFHSFYIGQTSFL